MKRIEIYEIEDLAPEVDKCLDQPTVGAIVEQGASLPLWGWVYSSDSPVQEVIARSGERLSARAACNIPRPRAQKRFCDGEEGLAGFKGKVPPGDLEGEQFECVLSALSEKGERPLWKFLGRQLEGYGPELLSKKLFYMHIAKTAGSSVNSFISGHYPEGACREHIEAIHLNKATREEVVENKLYLSGHITLEVALIRKYIDKNFKIFTIFREPEAQLISHLSWVKRLSLPEHRANFENHPEHIQDIARRLGSLSLEEFISSMTSTEKDLFDNVQTRYLANTFCVDLNPDDEQRALKALERFDVVGITELLPQSLHLLCHHRRWHSQGLVGN